MSDPTAPLNDPAKLAHELDAIATQIEAVIYDDHYGKGTLLVSQCEADTLREAASALTALRAQQAQPVAKIFFPTKWEIEYGKLVKTEPPQIFALVDLSQFEAGTPLFLSPQAQTRREVVEEIEAERRRQIEREGWDAEHDDGHADGSLSLAAMCYVQHAAGQLGKPRSVVKGVPGFWPWDEHDWKPKDARRDLIRAAALIVAEIERLDRALAPAIQQGKETK